MHSQTVTAAALLASAAWAQAQSAASRTDWLLVSNPRIARCVLAPDGSRMSLENGLVRRVLQLKPNAATVGMDNLMTGESMLRAVRPEAAVWIDGVAYPIGGLTGQPDLAYLTQEWLNNLQRTPGAFRYASYYTRPIQERFPWRRARPSDNGAWPPKGVEAVLTFKPPDSGLPGVTVEVHYEVYQGLPLLCKWLTIRNGSSRAVRLNKFEAESVAFVERESIVDSADSWAYPNVTAVTDYSFGGMSVRNSTKTIFWDTDPQYTSQVNYELKTPCVLVSRPPVGPDVDIEPGGNVSTFRTWLLLHDSSDRERRGLEVRRMYRTIAPWSTENPLMLHLTSTDPTVARQAMDQAAAVGFEMVILSFGSGLNMEDESAQNIAKFKALADYAHLKGLQLGGYSLLASRHIDDTNDVINPTTGKPGGAIFGYSPCLGSVWGENYFKKVRHFLTATGFDLLENDGSYPGDLCASTTHPGHHGLQDSQWTQYQQIASFYRWCRGAGIFLNVPDWYFLVGSNKTGMGYREDNWSLPRDQQHVHARQNMYDGTWEKAPSMGWMFVPLVEYHGGGAAATIEPMREHLVSYGQHLMDNLGYGVQACWRGPRLYDADETKKLVEKWVGFFKRHRAILQSDVVHLRRADGRDWDGILHVNSLLQECGLAMLYNPTHKSMVRTIRLPLYYTGLTNTVTVRIRDGETRTMTLDRDYGITVRVTIPADSCTWAVLEGKDEGQL